MTEYRLNDALGGHPVKVVSRGTHVDGPEQWRVVVRVDDESWPMWLPGTVLEEVVPPLPTEPDLLGVVLDGLGIAHQRLTTASVGWGRGGLTALVSWDEVCAHGDPTVLVPDPFAEPVTLPWATNVGLTFFTVSGSQREGVALELHWRGMLPAQIAADLSPDLAEDAARALWAAAQRARGVADAAEAQR